MKIPEPTPKGSDIMVFRNAWTEARTGIPSQCFDFILQLGRLWSAPQHLTGHKKVSSKIVIT